MTFRFWRAPTKTKEAQVQSRRDFFERLRAKVTIPGIVAVERDTRYDDEKLRNAEQDHAAFTLS
jgi:hypothetical protein